MWMRVIITNYTHTDRKRARIKITRNQKEYERKKTTRWMKKQQRIRGGSLISFVLTIATTNRTTKINIKINNGAVIRAHYSVWSNRIHCVLWRQNHLFRYSRRWMIRFWIIDIGGQSERPNTEQRVKIFVNFWRNGANMCFLMCDSCRHERRKKKTGKKSIWSEIHFLHTRLWMWWKHACNV